MIDTHCHLDDYEDISKILNKMNSGYLIASGADHTGNIKVLELIEKFDHIYGTIGLHPEFASNYTEEQISFVEKNCLNDKIVGIGEIGLDYHYPDIDKEKQKELFIKQLEIAKKYKKTVIIHSRDAALDTFEILEKYGKDLKIVLHCYSYSLEMAKRYKTLNVKFGIGGVVTFKNASKLQEVVKYLDLEDILLETDSPYLTPEPHRGEKNEPYNIYFVAKKISELKNIPLEVVLKQTLTNSISQFDLDI